MALQNPKYSCRLTNFKKVKISQRFLPEEDVSDPRLGVFLLPSGRDASPSQGYPQHQIHRYSFIHLSGGEGHSES